jgi:uncharacterized protein (TIGR02301 family)
MTVIRLFIALAALLALLLPALAQGSSDVPYDKELQRLAEVLGSVHYLRNVCGEESNQWRDRMQDLLAAENPEPLRRSRLVASFNRGYRTFDSVYTSCTQQALDAIERYMQEGAELSREINSRYGE